MIGIGLMEMGCLDMVETGGGGPGETEVKEPIILEVF